jgi:hypothetical protein
MQRALLWGWPAIIGNEGTETAVNASVNPSASLGVRGLAPEGGVGMPLDAPPRPGESYTTEPVFDPPAGAGLSGERVNVRA